MILVYTIDAIGDLTRLRKFIELDNPTVAQQISTKLIEGITTLLDHPKLGHPVSKAPNPELIRDLILGKYIVRYIIHKDTIAILRIWHHLEDRENEF